MCPSFSLNLASQHCVQCLVITRSTSSSPLHAAFWVTLLKGILLKYGDNYLIQPAIFRKNIQKNYSFRVFELCNQSDFKVRYNTTWTEVLAYSKAGDVTSRCKSFKSWRMLRVPSVTTTFQTSLGRGNRWALTVTVKCTHVCWRRIALRTLLRGLSRLSTRPLVTKVSRDSSSCNTYISDTSTTTVTATVLSMSHAVCIVSVFNTVSVFSVFNTFSVFSVKPSHYCCPLCMRFCHRKIK